MEFKYAAKNHGLEKIGLNILDNPAETCDVARRAGYTGIEIKGQPDKIPPKLAKEVAAAATSVGVSIPAVGGAWGAWDAGEERDLGSSDASVRRQALDYAARCIDLAADLGSPVFEICCAPFKQEYPYPSRSLAEVRAYFVEALSEMCAYAASRGVAIAIEPINRFTMSVNPKNSRRKTSASRGLAHCRLNRPGSYWKASGRPSPKGRGEAQPP